MPKLSLKDVDVKGKRVLMRVDFNVPMDKGGSISDDTRIVASLPSIKYVLENGGSLILMSHLGRPKEKPSPEFSLAPCAKRLSEKLNIPVPMAPDCVGEKVKKMAKQLKPGEVLLLENLRFHPGEEHPKENPEFAKQLSELGDIYVNDAFGTAHRAHSSTAEIAKYFPNRSAAGFLLQKEIDFLGHALINPKRPFYAMIGGAKISTKIGVLKALLQKADKVFIGGGMAYTFFKAEGKEIGNSIHEDSLLGEAKELLKLKNKKLFLPKDILTANRISNDAETRLIESSQPIPQGFEGVDIGPQTVKSYVEEIKGASTVFWNGPMGIFEIPKFATGTNAIAKACAELKGMTIVGGGESVAAVEAAGVTQRITHISTGGGASLEYIEFGKLPGIEVLSEKQH